ncbi:cylicin [Trema orientale]|uniref:Cylicin n=1 Tax=Trema orientale TaxID=63057 RepID=A0A2P5F829_TREOI|nr:cylicin [Trema orientale]
MSRCYPFPPPSYANKGEALGELIKLQREKEEAKSNRKEKKLLKKLGKQYSEGFTRTHRNVTDGKVRKVDDEKYYLQKKSKTVSKARYPLKTVDDESDQLEKSDLTEEQEQPTCSGSICFVSDSTQSSKKRRRQEDSLSNDGDSQRPVIRIRLPSRNNREPDTLIEQKKKIRFTTGTGSEARVQKSSDFGNVPSFEKSHCTNVVPKKEIENVTLKPCRELPLATRESRETKSETSLLVSGPQKNSEFGHVPILDKSRRTNAVTKTEIEKPTAKPCGKLLLAARESGETNTASETNMCVGGIQSLDPLYRTLIVNWVPPRLELDQNDSDDQGWLFGSKQEIRQESRIQKSGNVVSCSRTSSLWPQANYLSEVDVFALPFTVPY